ncbi:MAG TPA: DUF6600 domain-containing protein [Candidatus Acidoferrum sp.]|nr:DUF6600 domain-containing protein [Candidatus Acidoferrum sp.]
MNPNRFGGAIWLLLFGAASVLLIGAFTRFDSGGPAESTAATAPDAAAVAHASISGPEATTAAALGEVPTLPSDLSAGLAEIIKMAQAHIPDDTILAFIQNSGENYNPSADEILYLNDLGLSDRVVAALVKKPEAVVADNPVPTAPPAALATPEMPAAPVAPPMPAGGSPLSAGAPENMIDAPAPATVEAPPPLQNPQDSYFYDSLAPYGNWVPTADGWGWQPMVATVNADWRPYCDRGQWVLTDDGWYWQSDYSWGWGPFHYGRWRHGGGLGWVWIPGNVWAPAWVAWRNTTDGFAGWAALPPGVLFQPGVGLLAGAGRGGFKASYGLNAALFTFVPHTHFLAHNPGRFAAGPSRAPELFRNSLAVNNYSIAGGRIVNLGVSAGQIAAATKATVPKLAIQEVSSPAAAGGKGAGGSLAVYRPKLAAPALRSSAEKPAPPVLVNKAARPAMTEAEIPRAGSIRPGTVAPEHGAQAPRPSTEGRSGFISSGFQPPASRMAASTAVPPLPTSGRQALRAGSDGRRLPTPTSLAPDAGYPAYSQRGLSPAPPALPGSGQINNAMPRNAPANSAPSYEGTARNSSGYSAPASAPQHSAPAAAPSESHGSGGQSGGSGGSSSSSNSSKTGK